MPKPIAVMYVPNGFKFGGSLDAGALMNLLNGWKDTQKPHPDLLEYLWFCFEKDEINAPEFRVFHPNNFTEIQYEELKELVFDNLQSIKNQPPQQS